MEPFKLTRIYSTGYPFWDIYTIVRKAFCPYRGIKLSTAEITDRAKLDESKRYVNLVRMDGTDRDNKPVVIVILDRMENGGNEIATITERFKLFVNNLKAPNHDIIIISPCNFATHVLNFIEGVTTLRKHLYRYNWDQFKTVHPLGVFCSELDVLTDKQADDELSMFNMERSEMKKMFSNDPQNDWLGAKPGQVIRIKRTIPGTGFGTDYRLVVEKKV
jgi:DNA-directed RNA polymerase subunit H (RpoH/RPB5)